MSSIIDTIVEETALELDRRIRSMPPSRLERALVSSEPVRDFTQTLKGDGSLPRVIAEVKKASPSKGVIREEFYPVEVASAYEAGGAAAISILTNERHFQGRLEHLSIIRRFVQLPLLRKDFIIHPYQVTESRVAGADAVLLIASVLDDDILEECLGSAQSLGLHSLVEVHTEEELKRALALGAKLVGINNRDLRTFKVDIETTFKLMKLVPEGVVVVSESGIQSKEDLVRLKEADIDAVLVGETFMRAKDIRAKVEEFTGKS
jgi:indole-3-glycerol phosphate synthase